MPPLADSAGVPFEGRRFHENPGAGDDGTAPPAVLEAISRFRARELGAAGVVAALHEVRLLVPLVTVRGHDGVGAHGQLVDKTQELSIVTVRAPDGRPALPAFTSVAAMQAWDPASRPIPIEAPRIALAAASEGTPLVVVDPGSATEFAVRRPALRALATGEAWTPCVDDPEVERAFLRACEGVAGLGSIALVDGDPDARLSGPELRVVVRFAPGAAEAGLAILQERWTSDAVIAERVDSLGVVVEAG